MFTVENLESAEACRFEQEITHRPGARRAEPRGGGGGGVCLLSGFFSLGLGFPPPASRFCVFPQHLLSTCCDPGTAPPQGSLGSPPSWAAGYRDRQPLGRSEQGRREPQEALGEERPVQDVPRGPEERMCLAVGGSWLGVEGAQRAAPVRGGGWGAGDGGFGDSLAGHVG